MQGGLTLDLPAEAATEAILGRYLNGPASAPVALALSGGGDSVALLCLAKAWADRVGRRLIALTVDHGLQAPSDAWARFAAERAGGLGVACQVLRWLGEKPSCGVVVAARTARHALLADAARAAGARVILMAHTADDLVEAELMRREGSTTPSPRTWSPSPAWPEGRGVFLLRPLLGCRREALRDYLRALGKTWIEDPANADPRSARARARAALALSPPSPPWVAEPERWAGFDMVEEGMGGELHVSRAAIAALSRAEARRLVGALALCAAGTSRPPPSAAVERMVERLRGDEPLAATMAGARFEAAADAVTCCREPGELARHGVGAAALVVGQSLFDGRFLIQADEQGWHIAPLRGLAARLSDADQRTLRLIRPPARAAMPAALSPGGDVLLPAFTATGPVRASSLGLQRLRATLGAVSDEASAAISRPGAL